ncbi:MAG: hypothetical protein HZB43_00970 [candidate division Zixibacteria bacterium]|nr:hypothetical protein [candidate division Zixibacteria bacterium]
MTSAIEIIFGVAPTPDPAELVELNCDGLADVFDVNHLIDYSFAGGLTPSQ